MGRDSSTRGCTRRVWILGTWRHRGVSRMCGRTGRNSLGVSGQIMALAGAVKSVEMAIEMSPKLTCAGSHDSLLLRLDFSSICECKFDMPHAISNGLMGDHSILYFRRHCRTLSGVPRLKWMASHMLRPPDHSQERNRSIYPSYRSGVSPSRQHYICDSSIYELHHPPHAWPIIHARCV